MPSSRTARGRRVTASTAWRSGTTAASSSSTPAAWRSAPGTPSRRRVQDQARLAIEEADVIVFVVDAAAGLTPADQEVAETLRLASSPVVVAVNKADNEKLELQGAEFLRLGWAGQPRRERAAWSGQRRPARRRRGGAARRIGRRAGAQGARGARRRARRAGGGGPRSGVPARGCRGLRRLRRADRTGMPRRTTAAPWPSRPSHRPRRASPSWAGPTWASRRCSTAAG